MLIQLYCNIDITKKVLSCKPKKSHGLLVLTGAFLNAAITTGTVTDIYN